MVRRKRKKVIWYQDVSGSIDPSAFGTHALLVQALYEDDEVLFQKFDHCLVGDAVGFDEMSLAAPRGGGTDYRPVFLHAAAARANVVIIATDGYGYGAPVVEIQGVHIIWLMCSLDAPQPEVGSVVVIGGG